MVRVLRLLAIGSLGIILTGSAAIADDPTPAPAPAPAAIPVALPSVSSRPPITGDAFTYTVTVRDGKGKTARTSTITETLASGFDYEGKHGVIRATRDKSDAVSYFHYDPKKEFSIYEVRPLTNLRSADEAWRSLPLTKGKKVVLLPTEYTVDIGSSKSTTHTSGSIRVIGAEKLKIGKKNFTTVKVRETKSIVAANEKGKKTNSTITYDYWIAPDLGTIAKYTVTSSNGASFTQALTKYKLATPEITTVIDTTKKKG